MPDEFERALLNAIDKEMDNLADTIFNASQDNLIKPHRKEFKSGKSKTVITTDTAKLLQSGNIERNFLEKTIVYTAPYAEDVEYGNAGKPINYQQLERWVRRKVMKGKGSPGAIKRVTDNIYKSLQERGQSADPFLRPAMEAQL